jgi:hypothetical protein
MDAHTRPGARPRTPLAAAMLIPSPWTRPPIQAGAAGLGSQPCTPATGYPSLRMSWCKKRARQGVEGLDAVRPACTHRCGTTWAPSNARGARSEGCTVFDLRRRWLRFEPPSVAAPWGPCPKVWPPCSSSNKEPSKTAVWLPCSGHVQEQKRLPPRIPDESTRSPPGSRQKGGLCRVRACVCDAFVLVFVQTLAASMPDRGRHRKGDGRSSRSLQGRRQPQHSGAQPAKQGEVPMTSVQMD